MSTYRGRRRSCAASGPGACWTGPQPASGLATRLGTGAWRPGLPAAAAAAAGVEPAGPRADSGRLGEAAVAAAAPGCCCCSGRGGSGGPAAAVAGRRPGRWRRPSAGARPHWQWAPPRARKRAPPRRRAAAAAAGGPSQRTSTLPQSPPRSIVPRARPAPPRCQSAAAAK